MLLFGAFFGGMLALDVDVGVQYVMARMYIVCVFVLVLREG